jgi:hypothetical protein
MVSILEGHMLATKIKLIERQVKNLDRDGLAAFRDWFRKFDSDAWDRQIARDVRAGKLEKLAKQALTAAKAGKIQEL